MSLCNSSVLSDFKTYFSAKCLVVHVPQFEEKKTFPTIKQILNKHLPRLTNINSINNDCKLLRVYENEHANIIFSAGWWLLKISI